RRSGGLAGIHSGCRCAAASGSREPARNGRGWSGSPREACRIAAAGNRVRHGRLSRAVGARPRGVRESTPTGIQELMTTRGALVYDVIIVGAGPAGLCAAMYAGRGMLKSVTLERGAP